MTLQERRGKRLFLVLATLIILEKLAGVVLALIVADGAIDWRKSILQPLGTALAVGFLWQGDVWLRWLVGIALVLWGGLMTFVSAHVLILLAKRTPPDDAGFYMRWVGYPIGIFALFGLFYLTAGLLFLISPSMRAFFRYQREGPRVMIVSE